MKQIRQSVFETNSSSTHAIIVAKESDYDKWMDNDGVYYSVYNDKLTTVDSGDAMDAQAFYDAYDPDIVVKRFTDSGGEKMIAISVEYQS